jgi:transposase
MEPWQTAQELTRPSAATRPSCGTVRSAWSWRPSSRPAPAPGRFTRIARQLGIGTESLRSWVRQAEVDGGVRPGTSTQDKERIAALEREVRELRRTNEILRTASAFFAAELDGRRPR